MGPRLGRDAKLLIAASGVLAISFFGILLLLRVLYVLRLGHGPEYVGLFSAVSAFAYMAMSLPSAALGKRYGGRLGLVNVLTGLARLYKRQGDLPWKIVAGLAGLFEMDGVLISDFEEKLRGIIESCPLGCARTNPPLDGNFLPRTIYCGYSPDESFRCEHLVHSKIEVQDKEGRMQGYSRCGTLGDRLQEFLKKEKG